MAKVDEIYMCPHCVLNGDLSEVDEITEKDNLVGFRCPKCGIQVAVGTKEELSLAALTRASAAALGWNIKLLGRVLFESIRQGLKDKIGK